MEFVIIQDRDFDVAVTPILEKLHAGIAKADAEMWRERAIAGHGKFKPKTKLEFVAS